MRFIYNKSNRCTNFPNLFWLKITLYMFRAVPLPIIRSSLTVHLALIYVIRFEDSLRAGRSGDRIPVDTRFSALVQSGIGTHLALYTAGYWSFLMVERSGRDVNHHLHPAPRLKRGQSHTCGSLLGLHGKSYGELYLYLYFPQYIYIFFFFLALRPPLGVVFYSPLVGFRLLACEVS